MRSRIAEARLTARPRIKSSLPLVLIWKRDGLPPIAFTGEKIASASNSIGHEVHANRGTITVRIYRTKGGKFIAHVSRRNHPSWQGEEWGSDAAASFETAAGVIDWLKEGGTELGTVSQSAVERAAEASPEFAAAWVEEVQ